MGIIFLDHCRFYGYHGVLAEENTLGQIFDISCRLTLDLEKAAQSDDLTQTVSYAEVYEILAQHAEKETYQLLEKLAGQIISAIFERYPVVQNVWIRVAKENPPINGHYDQVGIEMEESR